MTTDTATAMDLTNSLVNLPPPNKWGGLFAYSLPALGQAFERARNAADAAIKEIGTEDKLGLAALTALRDKANSAFTMIQGQINEGKTWVHSPVRFTDGEVQCPEDTRNTFFKQLPNLRYSE